MYVKLEKTRLSAQCTVRELSLLSNESRQCLGTSRVH